ncbi:MAG: hypothetical protein GXY89_02255 [Tissierellia bacterium]|jgi:Ca2+/Na+ antiporter|nr:hypothetical protein [Tissierellia bacterium]
MKERKKDTFFHLIPIFISFYLLPLAMNNTGSAILILLILMPLVVLISSYKFSIRNGFNISFPLLVMVLFLPTLFIFYNSSAWIYAPIFGGISLLVNFLGSRLQN